MNKYVYGLIGGASGFLGCLITIILDKTNNYFEFAIYIGIFTFLFSLFFLFIAKKISNKKK